MRVHLSSALLIVHLAVITGCKTPERIPFSAVECPEDRALVYVYWGKFWAKADNLTISVNAKRVASLHSPGYYPLILEPGVVQLGYSVQVHPIFPINVGKTISLTLPVESGKTYYVAYRPWNGGWWPQLVLVDAAVGETEIAKCTLGKVYE